MKVMIDDGYDWGFMRSNDGKVFDSKGNEIKWVPIGDIDEPTGFTWKPVDEPMGGMDDINWLPIGDDEPIEELAFEKSNGAKSKTISKGAKKNGNAK